MLGSSEPLRAYKHHFLVLLAKKTVFKRLRTATNNQEVMKCINIKQEDVAASSTP